MAYIGNSSTTQTFSSAIDYFSGNASTTAFTLSQTPASVSSLYVVVANVDQNPSSAYTLSGNVITFTSAPPTGTNNIYVRYFVPVVQLFQPTTGSVGLAQLSATGTASSSTYLRGDNTWAATGATGGGTDQIFNLNGQTVTTNYTVPSGKNAVTAGTVTINTGVVVTVSTGSRWVVV
jgi:hypothetical protein